jgi:hypothetical protein
MKPTKEVPPPPRNGVDTPNLFATIGLVADQPELAKFQFRAENRWVDGTHSWRRRGVPFAAVRESLPGP